MRATILVERLSRSYGSYVIGADATRLLSTISGISEVKVERQFIDAATLSYECGEGDQKFEQIDQLLMTKGMQRVT
jgi:hypothetical protein